MTAIITPETSTEALTRPAKVVETAGDMATLAAYNTEMEEWLDQRFEAERLSALCEDYLRQGYSKEHGTTLDLLGLAGDRPFVVVPISADSDYADIGVSVETKVFAERFKRSQADVYTEYEKTNSDSTMLCLISLEGDRPKPVGAIRIIEPNAEAGPFAGLKSIVDLVEDSGDPEQTPWADQIKLHYFNKTEAYNPEVAWARLCDAERLVIDPKESHDVATISVLPEYAGVNGSMESASMLLYHTCLRYALGNGIKNLVSIQDLKPYGVLKQFGRPFSEFPQLTPKKYGGPFPTIPAVSMLSEGMSRIRRFDQGVASVFIDGYTLNSMALLLDEINPGQYDNSAVGLPTLPEAA